MLLFEDMRSPAPHTPRTIPINFFLVILSLSERKWAKTNIIIGIVAIHKPTKIEVR